MATIGLRDLFIAKITEGTNGVEAYETPRRLAKAISVEMSTEIAEVKLFADDGVDRIEKEFVSGGLKLDANDIENEDAAEILGQTIDDNGVLIAGENDDPPYYAVGFRAKKRGNVYKYVWLLKVKFSIPDESYKTKGESINFQTPKIEGEFIKREKDGNWKFDHVGATTDPVCSKWFEKVYEPAFASGASGGGS